MSRLSLLTAVVACLLVGLTGRPAGAGEALRTYNVRDLAPGKGVARLDVLIAAITSCVKPDTWQDVGGAGRIGPLAGGKIKVFQTTGVHAEITGLLKALRKLPPAKAGKPKKIQPPAEVKPGKRDAKERIFVYHVLDLVRKPAGDDYETLIERITKIAPDTWADAGGPGAYAIVPLRGALVITQTLDVHKRLTKELAKLRKKRN